LMASAPADSRPGFEPLVAGAARPLRRPPYGQNRSRPEPAWYRPTPGSQSQYRQPAHPKRLQGPFPLLLERVAGQVLLRQFVPRFVAQLQPRILVKTAACHPYCELIEKILQCLGARVGSAPREARWLPAYLYSSMETTRG
jgi:hypothetical protein